MDSPQSIRFKYTSFVTVILYFTVFVGILFVGIAYVHNKIVFDYGIWILKGFWIPVILTYALSMLAYEKWLYRFVEKEGVATVLGDRIDIKLRRSHKTILFEDILRVEYKPYRGNYWYALVITTDQH